MFKIKYLLTIISAVVMALTLTFDNLWVIALVGLVPFFYVLFKEQLTLKQGFKIGLIFGFTYYFVLLHWILSMYPLDNYGLSNFQSVVVLLFGWIFLSLYEGIWLSIIPVVFIKLKGRISNNILVIGALWILVEWGQQIGSLGFPWGRLAISQVSLPAMIQSSSVFGSLIVTFIIVIINALICYGVINRKNVTLLKRVSICIVGILFLNISFGIYKINKDFLGNEAKVAIIQGNISSSDKWNSLSLNNHLERYLDLSYEAYESTDKLDYIVWPETAIPIILSSNQFILDKYKKLASDTNATLIVGAYHEYDEKSYNAIYAISPEGEVSLPYAKRQLVPFGEFLPFESVLSKVMPFLNDVNMFENSIAHGTEINLLSTPKGEIGGLICFESIFPSLTRDITKKGAELIVIGTNDSWFKDSRGIYEHLKHSVLRAAESNRYVVRAANTGVSTVIDSSGKVLGGIDALETGYLVETVEMISDKTLYTYIGDIIVLISAIYIAILCVKRRKLFQK